MERVLSLQPNVKKLYLLVRASDNKSAEQRLRNEVYLHTYMPIYMANFALEISYENEFLILITLKQVFEKDLFKVLRKNIGDKSLNSLISEKVVPVPGDITLSNMGVNDFNLLQDMMQEIDIVFHAAATTRFDERLWYIRCI